MASNFTFIRGNTQNITLKVMDAEQASAVQPTDVIYFTAKTKYDDDSTDTSAVISKTMDAGDILDPSGEITFKLTSAEMNIEPGKYVYDIVLRQADYDRVTLLDGKITIKPATTLRGF